VDASHHAGEGVCSEVHVISANERSLFGCVWLSMLQTHWHPYIKRGTTRKKKVKAELWRSVCFFTFTHK
jgi:hypothetical protein